MAQDIKIVEVDQTTGLVSFKVSSQPVTGMDLLIQLVILSLLNIPGHDVLDLDDGGGIPEMVGMNIDASDSTEVVAEASRRIKKTQVEIVNAQAGLNIDAEQKLREIYINGISQGNTIDEVLIKIRIVNEAGRITDIVV